MVVFEVGANQLQGFGAGKACAQQPLLIDAIQDFLKRGDGLRPNSRMRSSPVMAAVRAPGADNGKNNSRAIE